MQRTFLKSKIHRATVTGADLHYEGSLAIDRDLMEAVDILPGEQVHVFNINNGARLVTYAIEGPSGTGTMMLNGAAARLGEVGDLIIVVTYCQLDDVEQASHQPVVIKVNERNQPVNL